MLQPAGFGSQRQLVQAGCPPTPAVPASCALASPPLRCSWRWPCWRLINTKDSLLHVRGPCFKGFLLNSCCSQFKRDLKKVVLATGTEECGVPAAFCRKHPTESVLLIPSFYTASLGHLSEMMSGGGSWSQSKPDFCRSSPAVCTETAGASGAMGPSI